VHVSLLALDLLLAVTSTQTILNGSLGCVSAVEGRVKTLLVDDGAKQDFALSHVV
jgi:hypothetical protein